MNIFVWKLSKIASQKKVIFLHFFHFFFDLLRFSVFFNGLFAPTSRNRMSNIFTDSESSGKEMERSGLRYEHFCWKIVENCVTKKSFFSPLFFDLLRFLVFLTVFLPPLPEVGYPIFLEIQNPWGKVMKRSGLRYEHFCLKIVYNRRAKKVFFFTFFGLLRFSVFFNGLFAPTSRSRMSNIW